MTGATFIGSGKKTGVKFNMNYKLNPDKSVVKRVKRGLRKNNGYCPCRTEKNEDTKCMCTEFRDQLEDPEFTGFCHCMLYCKTD